MPASQMVQVAELVCPVAAEYFPGTHLIQTEVPVVQAQKQTTYIHKHTHTNTHTLTHSLTQTHTHIHRDRERERERERESLSLHLTFCFRIRARWAWRAGPSCGGGSTRLAIFANSAQGAGTRRGSCNMHKYIHSYIVYSYTPQNSMHVFRSIYLRMT